jgi:hypothetical protein
VDGANYGCGIKGFNVSKGWDPVTGLGTPDYLRLRDLYLVSLKGGLEFFCGAMEFNSCDHNF